MKSNVPNAAGPYSQTRSFRGLIFCSGQIGKDPESGEVVSKEIVGQTKQVLKNLGAVLEQEGSGYENVLKTTVYLKNMDDYSKMNEVYGSFFKPPYPARAAVEVGKLPLDVLVEIECVAIIDQKEERSCKCCS